MFAMLLVVPVVAAAAADRGCRASRFPPPGEWPVDEDGTRMFEHHWRDAGAGPTTLALWTSSGSTSGSIWGTLVTSRSGKSVALSLEIPFSEIVSVHPVPPILTVGMRFAGACPPDYFCDASALELVEEALFGTICRRPDPSLAWLLDRHKTITWHEGRPELPTSYAMFAVDAAAGFPGREDEHDAPVWIAYRGHNHAPAEGREGAFARLDSNARFVVLGTLHGVVVTDDTTDRYAWIYVFSGGHKLRWKSIESAEIDGDRVSIRARLRTPGAARTGIIVVDLDSGAYSETWSPLASD